MFFEISIFLVKFVQFNLTLHIFTLNLNFIMTLTITLHFMTFYHCRDHRQTKPTTTITFTKKLMLVVAIATMVMTMVKGHEM